MRVVVLLLTVTVLTYTGVYVYEALSHPLETAAVESGVHEDCVELSGLILREETVLKHSRPYCSITARHARRVAVGDELGLAYDSEAALLHAERLESLQREIELADSVLEAVTQEKSGAERAEDARSAVLSLSADIARHDTTTLLADALQLRSRIFDDGAAITQSERDALLSELQRLRLEDGGEAEGLFSPASGVFTPLLDGRENLTPSMLENLNVTLLQTLMERQAGVDQRSYGKLVTSHTWYVAALMSEESAARLQTGDELRLDLTRYRAEKPRITVLGISEAQDGKCAVSFSCSVALSDTLSLRSINCPLILNTINGLRIPAEALRQDAQGQNYVYIDAGGVVRRADVAILWQDENEALVESDQLRRGTAILLGGRSLYDGKPL
ncbi:MAG: hypothetical protein IJE26_00995 [Oscillospiraceae bacterium]|nr:hypothetical protein [Oscillospiraceae bacterium]